MRGGRDGQYQFQRGHGIVAQPAKIARAIIGSADESPAPKRLVLGGGAYEQITAALRDRLAALEAQRELAYATGADDGRRSRGRPVAGRERGAP